MFEYVSPADAGPAEDRTQLAPSPDDKPARRASRYAWPGAYRFGTGADATVHAVNITGLRPAKVRIAPEAAVSALSLPVPRRETTGIELWPVLLALAVALWIGGWCVRLR